MTVMLPIPQPGIFAAGVARHVHLEFSVRGTATPDQAVASIARARRAVAAFNGPNATWGFRPRWWRQWGPTPEGVDDFAGVTAVGRAGAPATGFDIWLWLSAADVDRVNLSAIEALENLADVADCQLRLDCYTDANSDDPTGFQDGTENPPVDRAAQVSLFDAPAACTGSTLALVQKWVHDVEAFRQLPVAEQEQVFGRSRKGSIEIPEDVRSPQSHVSRNQVLDETGEERKIFRRNTQFQTDTEAGSQFIGFTNDPPLITTMLERMFGNTEDGLHDRFTDFSRALTGSFYYCPSLAELSHVFGGLDDEDSDGPPERIDEPSGAGATLGIGSLLQAGSVGSLDDNMD